MWHTQQKWKTVFKLQNEKISSRNLIPHSTDDCAINVAYFCQIISYLMPRNGSGVWWFHHGTCSSKVLLSSDNIVDLFMKCDTFGMFVLMVDGTLNTRFYQTAICFTRKFVLFCLNWRESRKTPPSLARYIKLNKYLRNIIFQLLCHQDVSLTYQ